MSAVLPRRLDTSLNLFQDLFDALPEAGRVEASNSVGVNLISILSKVRGMEMAEEDVTGNPAPGSVADLYDRLVKPGAPLFQSLVHVALAAMCGSSD